MDGESLAELKAAFEKWRSRKRHVREAVPAELLQRARAAAARHSWAAVARVTKVDRGRLESDRSRGGKRRVPGAPGAGGPMYSRLELSAPAATARPFAEVEMPTGLRVRLFTDTGEALGLLSSLLGAGGLR
ncbi:MAG TPA: hypothetical protein VI197_32275 [Polyangiaceae bacterium]